MNKVSFQPDAKCPLDDVRIIDVSRFVAGNMFSLVLADLGAEVIKVEQPGKGDPLKDIRINGVSPYWKEYARNKKSVTLNLRHPETREILLQLVEGAQMLSENFVPGTMEKFGLGPDVLLDRNPKLVIVRISGWGQTGPYSHRPGFGTVAEAMSGFTALNGYRDQAPVLPPISLADMVAGLYAAMASMVALRHCEMNGGRGQVIDVSLFDPLFSIMGPEAAIYKLLGHVKGRGFDANTTAGGRNVYETKDGRWIAMSSSTQLMTERYFKAMGREELIDDPRFRTTDARLAHQEELDAVLRDFYAQRTLDENMRFVMEHNLTASPVYDIDQILQDTHVQERRVVLELPDPEGEMDGMPMHNVVPFLSETPGAIRRPAPKLGEHNAEIFGELGLGSADLERLASEGLI
jgi:crotonobetainyl-CoA:carnitine CoA-transferase CaiB-like acyl-CoA transferase